MEYNDFIFMSENIKLVELQSLYIYFLQKYKNKNKREIKNVIKK